MASDIQKAINSGGYVIVPEKAVDGVGRDAIYVYMTYNAQTGSQAWKISGGLNGGILDGENSSKLTWLAYLVDFIDAASSVFEATTNQIKSLSKALGPVFAILGVFFDLATAISSIDDIVDNCPGGLDNPIVQEAMRSIIALTISAIVMTTMLGVFAVLGGAVGGVVFAVLSNVISAMFNSFVSYVSLLAKARC